MARVLWGARKGDEVLHLATGLQLAARGADLDAIRPHHGGEWWVSPTCDRYAAWIPFGERPVRRRRRFGLGRWR